MGVGLIVFLFIGLIFGNWGSAAIGGLIVGAIVYMVQEDNANEKAHRNRRDYWAYGREPDWKREQRAKMERYERERAEKERTERERNAGSRGNTFRCNSCGRMFQGAKVYARTREGNLIYNVTCPACGKSSWRFEK